MARSTYKCGGKGRYGEAPKPCTRCGRMHPKGRKQKKRAVAKGWTPCKQYSANKKKESRS